MATVRVKLNKRASHQTTDGRYPLILNIGHKSKAREIPFNLFLHENQFDEDTKKITGIVNSVRQSKWIQKIFSEVDFWLTENQSEIKLWPIDKLKSEVEKKFFNKQTEITLLNHGAKYLERLVAEQRYSTAKSYEDALKVFTKYHIKQARKDDKILINSLFENSSEGLKVKHAFKIYDIAIKAIDAEMMKNFKAYLNRRCNSRNSVGIFLRSLQAILNDASASFTELQDHRPMRRIKKGSYKNAPNPLAMAEVQLIRDVKVDPGSSKFHAKNYFLFMFGNMGMNFFDMAILKRFQYDGERIKYFRKKTEYQGDYFSIKQNTECRKILSLYLSDQGEHDYVFPILQSRTPASRIHRVKNDRLGWFNKHLRALALKAEIPKDITSYSARDTWTNIGLEMGIDIRKISAGLGHSSIEVTNKHYGASIQEKFLDEINLRITARS